MNSGLTLPTATPQQTQAREPLLWAFLAYSSGIFFGHHVWRPFSWWLVSTLVFVLSAAYFRGRRARLGFLIACSVLFVLGSLVIQICPPAAGSTSALPQSFVGQEVQITAHVTREGDVRRRAKGEIEQRLDLETEQIGDASQTVVTRCGVRLTAIGRAAQDPESVPAPVFHYGERIRFATKLSRPRNFRNPGSFDYQAYLAGLGISALGSTKAEEVEILPGFAGSRAELWRTEISKSVVAQIQRLWPGSQAALMNAMLIGDNTFVGRDLLTDFQRTGTYHVLVISGLKVGILAWMIFWLLRHLRVNTIASSAITVLLTLIYAWLTDVGTPVWRATLMLIFYFCAKTLYRDRAVLNTIAAAGLLLLLLDPNALFGASFQLSFLCVLIITAIGTPFLQRTIQPFSSAVKNFASFIYDFALPPKLVQFRLDLRMIAARLQRFTGARLALILVSATVRGAALSCQFLIISAILQMGFALPMAYYFHRATLVSLPANLFAVPLTEIALITSMAAIAISYFSFPLAKGPALIAGLSVQAMSGSVRWLGHLKLADTRVPTPDLRVTLIAGTSLILAMILVRRHSMLSALGLCVLVASGLWICFIPPHPQTHSGVLEVTCIDVGQGDSILLVSPHGQTLLVDAGGIPHWMHSELDIGEDVVSAYLWSRGFSGLDAVAVTHPHADHIGGMRAVIANFHPRELWLGEGSTSSELESLLRQAEELQIPVRYHHAGDEFESADLKFRVLAPAAAALQGRNANDDSLVMSATYDNTTALLEGDAEKAAEHRMAAEQPAADLLKVAHHGSATSTIPELLSAVHPRFAVISVGARNVYGHPRAEVLKRLEQAHVVTYRTDLDGAVSFYLKGGTVIPDLADLQLH